MDNRKQMINFALGRMYGFSLEKSSESDNRSIFSLIKTLIESASGDTFESCRRPLDAIFQNYKNPSPRSKFQGCKLPHLQQTIKTMFESKKGILSDGEFKKWGRGELLEYVEVCRRIFMSGYGAEEAKPVGKTYTATYTASNTYTPDKNPKKIEPKEETQIAKKLRMAQEEKEKKGRK